MATAAPHPLAQLLQGLAARRPPGAPGAGPGLPPPGGPPGMPPSPGGPGGPTSFDTGNVIAQIAQMPSPQKEGAALKLARDAIGLAISQVYMRSPQISKELSAAMINISQATEKLAALPDDRVMPPPPGMPVSGAGMDLGQAGMPALGG